MTEAHAAAFPRFLYSRLSHLISLLTSPGGNFTVSFDLVICKISDWVPLPPPSRPSFIILSLFPKWFCDEETKEVEIRVNMPSSFPVWFFFIIAMLLISRVFFFPWRYCPVAVSPHFLRGAPLLCQSVLTLPSWADLTSISVPYLDVTNPPWRLRIHCSVCLLKDSSKSESEGVTNVAWNLVLSPASCVVICEPLLFSGLISSSERGRLIAIAYVKYVGAYG